jgi:hypothetical protein
MKQMAGSNGPRKGKATANKATQATPRSNASQSATAGAANVTAVAQDAIKSSQALAVIAMTGAPAVLRLLVYVCYGVIVLVVISICVPPYTAQKQIFLETLGVVALLISGAMVLWRYRNLPKVQALPEVPVDGRPVATPRKSLLSDLVFQKVRATLEETRASVRDYLLGSNAALLDNHVRANIFIPEWKTGSGTLGAAALNDCVLKIYPGLSLKMDREGERAMALKIGQGVTGQVFADGKARVVLRIPSQPSGWDSSQEITEELAAIIHPELQWIMSMRLEGSDGHPVGVMNIDGLREQFDVDTLYDCMTRLGAYAAIIGNFIARP